jgi:proteasome assembly chaperone 2
VYQLVPSPSPPLANSPLGGLSTLPIPAFAPIDAGADVPFIPGGGLTRRLLSALSSPFPTDSDSNADTPARVPTAALLHFVLEGDNRADAGVLATAVAHAVGIVDQLPPGGWRAPASWRAGLFGGAVEGVLYS